MCGIVGMVGSDDVVPFLAEGLRRLEYRGYDSAGVAVVAGERVRRVRAAGKIARLEDELARNAASGTCGIGHTRWATHGRPTDGNAHPHASCDEKLALVHNGIIENYLDLRRRLAEHGHELRTETDTEVLVHLVEDHLASCGRGGGASTLEEAVRRALADVSGVHALAVISVAEPDRLVVAMNGPPALVGLGDRGAFVASDLAPILPHARDVVFLEEGDTAVVTADAVRVLDAAGVEVERPPRHVDFNPVEAEKGGYKHFMIKEIHEQPRTLEESLVGHVLPGRADVELPEAALDDASCRAVERVCLIGCGTAYHAGLVGKYLIEALARLPCDVEIASELRYRDPLLSDRVLGVAVTQSGETADTVAAMREVQSRGVRLLAICNVLGSLATRVADGTIHTRAGLEIGVASTKAFTAQIVALTLLAIRLGRARGVLGDERAKALVDGLRSLPRLVEECLGEESRIDAVARETAGFRDFLYLGRGVLFPLALEGALKLKEISYVHAEGYPAGEMKHGPIALVDENVPVVGLCLASRTYEKTMANLEEVRAREGRVIAVATRGDERAAQVADHVLEVPAVDELLSPVVAAVPLQLLAYHVGVRRGCDVDQPRNLAKSVTVE